MTTTNTQPRMNAPTVTPAVAATLEPVARAGACSLPIILGFTFLNSAATGATFNGISFVTATALKYGPIENGLMGLMLGITYVIGALGASPAIKALRARFPSLTARTVLLYVVITAGVLNLFPVLVWILSGAWSDPSIAPKFAWAIWLFVGLYSTLCGALWPVVESYLSGGRRGEALRSAMGRFNVTWSGSLVVSMCILSPLQEVATMLPLAVMSLMHIASLIFLAKLPKEAGAHLHDDAHETPANYPKLLRVHRILLPTAYAVMYAMSPMLPQIIASIGLDKTIATPFAAIWLFGRVVAFFVFERWKSWHGTWVTATWGTALLLGGFALVVMSPVIAAHATQVVAQVACGIGLLFFGFGAAAIYCGALFYALEVGQAEVDAGGMHEAMIGLGYTVGPLCMLVPQVLAVPSFVSSTPVIGADTVSGLTLGLVGLVVGVGVLAAWKFGNRR
jgi:hypothetical protein